MPFNKNKGDGRIQRSRPTIGSQFVFSKALLKVCAATYVKISGSKTQNVDKAIGPRQARGHSTGIFNESHVTLINLAERHEQASNASASNGYGQLDSHQHPLIGIQGSSS